MRYLGLSQSRPRVGVFDLTGCEGCELQLANKEETLVAFLDAVDIVSFREVSSAASDDYEIALVDGAVSRDDEVERLEKIRSRANVVVALGSCACFGGVNRLKNDRDPVEVSRIVYGDQPVETRLVRPVRDVIPVDLEIPGCPVRKAEVERVVQHLLWDVPYSFPVSPVCLECKQRFTTCVFEHGALCLGPITRGGCNAPCPAAGIGCWGCRGPAQDPNLPEFLAAARQRGHGDDEIAERLAFFGGFQELS